MLERLPTPWGLVRLGVAPDHPKIKDVSRAFEKTAARPGFRFFGNVEVGRDVTHDELRELYDAVVYAVGAQTDRQLGIPGEDLPGSWAATEFVAWYNGHPDYQHLEFDLSGERAVVIGNGNVALDVARMLALTPEELAPTDTTEPAIDAINAAGRPRDPRARPPRPGAGGLDAGGGRRARRARRRGRRRRPGRSSSSTRRARPSSRPRRRRVKRNVDHLRDFAAREPGGKPRRIVLRFLASPVAIVGERPRRGDRGRPERARRRRRAVATDGARDDPVRDRLPQRRLPRRRAAGRAVRRVDAATRAERGRTRRAGALRAPAGSSAGRAA